MQSELEVIDSLEALRYKGDCLNNDVLTSAIENGQNNLAFRELILWLTNELHVLKKTDEKVCSNGSDAQEFAMELSAMLKELCCPYAQLFTNNLEQRFTKKENVLLLLDFLISELMATKMVLHLNPIVDNKLIINRSETNTARALQQLSSDWQIKIDTKQNAKVVFEQLLAKATQQMSKLGDGVLGEPLLKSERTLTNDEWQELADMQADLEKEYNLRRQMLLTRLNVTVQSFKWSDKKSKEITKQFEQQMNELNDFSYGGEKTDIAALLAARKDLAIIEKTSCANVRKNTTCDIQKHIIGSVPDRGGRAEEHAPPPPEMPSWQTQRAPSGGGGGGGRGGRGGQGGGGGGYNRGGGSGGRGHGRGGHNEQRPQFQQQSSYEQRQNYNNNYNNNNNNQQQQWLGGSGRVQGSGWTQNSNDRYERDDNRGGYGVGNGRGRGGGGGGGYYRGHSNYNRGGRR